MHELLTLASEILHFESYLTTRNWEEVMGTILQEKKDLESVKYQYLNTSTKEFDELTKDYFLYKRRKRKNSRILDEVCSTNPCVS